MYSVDDYIAFVKKQIDYQDRRAVMTRGDSKKNPFHVETAKQFRIMLEFLESLSNEPTLVKNVISDINPIAPLLPKELVGLPQELIDELSAKGTDKQELLIMELIEAAGGTLSLDRILIGIYNKSGVIMKRPAATAKLYRMIQKEMIYTVPKKKGIYTTIKPKNGDDLFEEEIGEGSLS
ncbi:MAG: hypothetical protein WBL28_04685 [Methylotenera sp.]